MSVPGFYEIDNQVGLMYIQVFDRDENKSEYYFKPTDADLVNLATKYQVNLDRLRALVYSRYPSTIGIILDILVYQAEERRQCQATSPSLF